MYHGDKLNNRSCLRIRRQISCGKKEKVMRNNLVWNINNKSSFAPLITVPSAGSIVVVVVVVVARPDFKSFPESFFKVYQHEGPKYDLFQNIKQNVVQLFLRNCR